MSLLTLDEVKVAYITTINLEVTGIEVRGTGTE